MSLPLVADVADRRRRLHRLVRRLKEHGPGHGTRCSTGWRARPPGRLKWFLTQEAAGEAGFDDLVAMTQVKVSDRAKLELARNYWDEMGRGARPACTARC
jgi:hypothetical protein